MAFGGEIGGMLVKTMAATAICCAGVAIGDPVTHLSVAGVVGIVEMLLGGAELGYLFTRGRSAKFGAVLRRCAREVEGQSDEWLDSEFRGLPDAAAKREAALAAIAEVLPRIVPHGSSDLTSFAEEIAKAGVSEARVAAFYLDRAAARQPFDFAELPGNNDAEDAARRTLNRRLFVAVMAGSYAVIARQPEFHADLLRQALAEVLSDLDDLKQGQQELRGVADQTLANTRTIDDRTRRLETMVEQLLAEGRTPAPLAERAAAEVAAAAAADTRLEDALERLRQGDVVGAEAAFRTVAEERRARIARDSVETAAAYRNLGAIAGLRDPKAALDAYLEALRFDPDDEETLLWAAWLSFERGSLADAERHYRRASELAGDTDSWSSYWARIGLGDVAAARGDLPAARREYDLAQTTIRRLAQADPGNAGWQRDLSVSYNKIGDVLVAQGNLPAALASFRAGLEIAQRLAQADPGNAGWQRDLSVSHERIGDVLVAQGDLAGALANYRRELEMMEPLAKKDPTNSDWQRFISVVYNKIGDVLVAQGNLPEALASFRAGLEIRQRLAQADPGNAGWQRDLSVSHDRIGDVLVAQGNLPEALASFRAGLEIAQRLAQADPGNAGGQRDLSVSHERIGDVLVAQGNLPEALASFRAGLEIAQRLAQADPGNAGWQRDLSVSYNEIGDVLVAQGNLPAALASFRAGLEIAQRLAQADPGNAGWQRDLSVSYNEIGDVLVAQGNLPAALASFRAGLEIAQRLAQADPGNAGWQRDLSVSHERIGGVLVAQGNLPAALASFRAGHEIFQSLAQADPGNAGWQRDVAVSHAKLGMTHSAAGAGGAAREHLVAGRAIMAGLVEKFPDWAEWRRDLALFERLLAEPEGDGPRRDG